MTQRRRTTFLLAVALFVAGSATALAADAVSTGNALLDAAQRRGGGEAPPAPRNLNVLPPRLEAAPTPVAASRPAPAAPRPPASPTRGTVREVSPQGNDGTPCGQGPRRTIAAGMACLASGETLLIRAGTYTECIMDYAGAGIPSGTSWAAPTTLKADPGVVLKQPAPECPGGAGTIEFGGRAQYVVVDGFTLDGRRGSGVGDNVGIGTGESAQHVRFQNIEVSHYRTNVSTMGSSLEFRNIHAHHAGHPICESPVGCHSFYFRGQHNLLDGARIHDNTCNGIQFTSGGGRPVAHNTVRNAEIYNNGCGGVVAYPTQTITNNHIHHNHGGINTYGDVDIRGNCVVDNQHIGILLQAGGNFRVYDNVLVGNPDAAIDTQTNGAALTDYGNNRCDRMGPGCTTQAGREAMRSCPAGGSGTVATRPAQ